MTGETPQPFTRHATSVAIDGQGIVIEGASGRGKSELALELISRGAVLISDDLTTLTPGAEDWPFVTGTGRMLGKIEARGMGILTVPYTERAPLALWVDMDSAETERLPDPRSTEVFGQAIKLVRRVDSPHFPAFLMALVKGGWSG